MFDLYTEYDPVTPTGGLLLAEIGIDIGAVREALADDLARPRPRRPGERESEGRERRVNGQGAEEEVPVPAVREPIVIIESTRRQP